MNEEIKELLQKHLPAQVGETLKERLAQADRDEKTVKLQDESIKDLKKDLLDLDGRLQEYKQFDVRNALLESREKELEARERNLEVETLKYQLASSNNNTEFARSVALGLVRNTEYRKNIFDTENVGGVPVKDSYGNMMYPIPMSKHYNESQTLE